MNQDQNNQPNTNQPTQSPRTVTTTITCKECGKTQEVTIEIPESTSTPKVIWND